ncbi:TetR/AcrR family transcriptional regulator [Virgibacillus sp. YIM 98842]|uniref:TetR/AcrR family transcriptional regulator n=1 Tax=Virgibacillus sp. YIM 98842 TaxID=2663533 RepID=UPI001F095102|nr:TetR/AcrR family transcriptional regulator [Virgibacillus sp. YIM 98842]
MPKQTFFNLPEDKKTILLDAVEKEFSRVPLFEASVANMVQDAGIPRGSFYQYFDNKEDAFFIC